MSEQQRQPATLSEARLEELHDKFPDPFWYEDGDEDSMYIAVRELLAEVDRLRAEVAHADEREGHILTLHQAAMAERDPALCVVEQARALLASEAGSPGENQA